ncbi:MAG: DUF4412 domain-containing protein [Syntrophorhabdaceae bacterium]|nr:DUF4412 domain-containing protein [Syntrophorhabdaceae bacterium]
MKPFVLALFSFLFFMSSLLISPSFSIEFSADSLIKVSNTTKQGKVYIKGENQRIEVEGEPVTIIIGVKKIAYILFPEERSYLEFPVGQGAIEKIDLSPKIKDEVSRKAIGEEKVNGYDTYKYEVVIKGKDKNEVIFQWVLKDMDIAIKTGHPKGFWSVEYKNLQKKVPDSLFEIPDKFEKISVPLPPGFPGIPEDDDIKPPSPNGIGGGKK